MAASAGRRTVLNGLGSRVRTMSVGAKLIFVSTALTIVAISSAFLVLSVSVKRHTERRLAETLAKHQQTLSNLERGKLDELLRISTLMTDSPLESAPGREPSFLGCTRKSSCALQGQG